MSDQKKIWDYFQVEGVDDFDVAIPRLNYLLKKAKFHLKNRTINSPKVMNIGIGNGWIEKACVKMDMEVSALDPSGIAVEQLRNAGINATKGTIVSMPFKDNSFNIVFCSEVFEHLEHDELVDGL